MYICHREKPGDNVKYRNYCSVSVRQFRELNTTQSHCVISFDEFTSVVLLPFSHLHTILMEYEKQGLLLLESLCSQFLLDNVFNAVRCKFGNCQVARSFCFFSHTP